MRKTGKNKNAVENSTDRRFYSDVKQQIHDLNPLQYEEVIRAKGKAAVMAENAGNKDENSR